MKIGICDDEIYYIDIIKTYLNEFFSEINIPYKLYEFKSGEEFLGFSGILDLLILDIEMQGISGISVKQTLILRGLPTSIIFLTNHSELMKEAFGTNVHYFLEKPVAKDEFFTAINPIILNGNYNYLIDISDNNKSMYIYSNEINYIEASGKYTYVYCNINKYLVRRSMREWQNILPINNFFLVHKSYIINFDIISKIETNFICINGKNIPLSRRKKNTFFKEYNEFIKRKVIFKC